MMAAAYILSLTPKYLKGLLVELKNGGVDTIIKQSLWNRQQSTGDRHPHICHKDIQDHMWTITF